ncbi:hypothetical protein SAY86_027176 [Trapa natans]|uniref:ULTRAPETALA1/2 SAND domain-containing protein n=1 Tax=Trapa natans TaxID=22666 RepID=A0AAN7KTC6_TRANT|nr:hypothetical protein SAY86_027176 [Trapa natans]
MANGKEGEVGQALLFSDDELREVYGFRRGSDYIEVTCGCTSHRYGDAVGRLRVFLNGDLEINCECFPGCNEGATRSAGSGYEQRRNAASIMMPWVTSTGNVLTTIYRVMRMKKGEAEWHIGDAPFTPCVKDARHASASGVTRVDSRIAAARLAWTSPEMPKLERLIYFSLPCPLSHQQNVSSVID